MANRKINELVTRTPSLSDLILVGDPSSGYSYKATVTALATIIETDIADGFVTLSTTQTISGAKTFTNAVLISANSPELNLNQGTSSVSYINFKENSSLVNRIVSSGATLTFITNNSATAALVLSSAQTATFGSIPNATTDTDKFLVSDGGTLKYRTGAEVLSDIGAASSSNISGTTNYIAKFTSSSAIGNSVIYESGGNIGIGTTTLTARLTVNGNAILSGSINATETYLSSPNGLVFQINSTNASGGYAEFQTNSTTIGKIGTATQVVGSGGTSVFAISSTGANDFILGTNGTQRVKIDTSGNVTFSQIANATTDTDKFLVSDSGVLKYRTGSELLSDIGGASSSSVSGTTNYIPKFTSSSAIGDSPLYDASGSIGLNSTTPALNGFNRELTVNAGTSGTARAAINIQGSRTSASTFGVLGFYHQTTYVAGIESSRGGDATSGILQFFTSNTTGATEKMRLDASGNLGINTSSPAAKLDVQGSSSDQIRLRTAATEYYSIGRNASTGFLDFYGSQSGYVGYVWGGVNGERMRLDASGNLGLGVTPSAWGSGFRALQISNSTALYDNNTGNGTFLGSNFYYNGTNNIYINSNTATAYAQYSGQHIWYQATSGTAGNAISFTQAMTLDASGRLGIGTTSPASYYSSKLVVSVGDEDGITIAGVNDNYLMFADGTTGDDRFRGFIQYSHTSDYMALATNAVERMRITSAGNVGIGITSPDAKLTVIDEIRVKTAATSGVGLSKDGSGAYLYNIDNTFMAFGTNNSERMRITSGGQVGIGTTSPASYEFDGTAPLVIANSTNTTFTIASGTSSKGYIAFADGTSGAARYTGNINYNHSNNSMNFEVNGGATALTITSAGELLINTTSNSATSNVGSKFVSNGRLFQVSSYSDNTQESLSMYSTTAAAYRFYVGWGGTIYATSTSISGISDVSLKQNIRDLDKGLNDIMQLKPRRFDWINGDSNDNMGFIAQEVEAIFPELVTEYKYSETETKKSLKMGDLIPAMVKAIQELKAEIETLKNK